MKQDRTLNYSKVNLNTSIYKSGQKNVLIEVLALKCILQYSNVSQTVLPHGNLVMADNEGTLNSLSRYRPLRSSTAADLGRS